MTSIAEIFAPPAGTNSTPEYTNSTSGADIMGKEDFLTLLVAQLQNQDPMNPDDPTEFTSQLAEFSSLEQLFNLNESIDGMVSSQLEADRFDTMGLIGKDIVYPDSTFSFSGEPISVGYQLDGTAASVTMYIQDENGVSIATLHPTELSEGDHFLEWSGFDNEGNEVPEGNYNIVLQASSAGDNTTIGISPLVQSEVTGVRFNDESGEPIIHTLAGAEIAAGSIIAVYQVQQAENSEETLSEEDKSFSKNGEKSILPGVTGTSTLQSTQKSAPTDEDQIKQDILRHLFSG
ncbi:MAG TPA: flagellar hook assembly protein FlgD [Desulfocapsa sulfexigens]|nr:flagellar hook assembly protein FlgD [Desulfocapsa sulfexigens]